MQFNNESRPRTKEGNMKNKKTFDSVNAVHDGRELTRKAFKSGVFPLKLSQGEWFKILTNKKMLRRLPTALAKGKAGNTSENLLKEICKIIYSFYQKKKKILLKKNVMI